MGFRGLNPDQLGARQTPTHGLFFWLLAIHFSVFHEQPVFPNCIAAQGSAVCPTNLFVHVLAPQPKLLRFIPCHDHYEMFS